MRSGGGVWHGKEMPHGDVTVNKGFQLWLALPSELENDLVDSQYIEASGIPTVVPTRVILGDLGGVASPVRPTGLNYLLVTLLASESGLTSRPKVIPNYGSPLQPGRPRKR